MKLPVIIAIILAIAGGTLIFLFVANPFGRDMPRMLASEEISALSESKQEAYFREVILNPQTTVDDKEQLVTWGILNRPALVEEVVRENAIQIRDLPETLATVALNLLRAGNGERAVSLMNLASELFPNNPEILGAMGIASYLGGRQEEARLYLEQAESWRQDNPLVDFYLGAILIQSANAADLNRGKTVLMRVVNRQDPELSEPAALALLTAPELPLIEGDFRKIFEALDTLNALRVDSPNLNIEVMRILINQALRYSPQHAMDLALMMFEFPGITDFDRLNAVELAQSLGEMETAGEILSKMEAAAFEDGSDQQTIFRRLSAVQQFAEGAYSEGLTTFQGLIETQPDNPQLPSSFQIVFTNIDLPLETERTLLELFLQLPVRNITLSLAALNRLMEVAPLQNEKWESYVVETLLPEYPSLASQWLTQQNKPNRVIEAFSPKAGNLNREQTIALVEAYLASSQPAEALAVVQASGQLINQPLKEFYHARCALALGQNAEAIERWKAAQNAALSSNNIPLMKNLGFLALELEQPVNALQALYTAFNAGIEFSQNQLGRLLNLTLAHGSLSQTIKVAKALEEAYPDEPVHKNNLAYFQFLANESIESSVATMRELVEDYPDVTQYRLTLALGLLRIGRTNEAKRLLDSTAINWDSAGTRGKMIYAAVLAASNQRVIADGLIQNIEFSDLIPEERALLDTD